MTNEPEYFPEKKNLEIVIHNIWNVLDNIMREIRDLQEFKRQLEMKMRDCVWERESKGLPNLSRSFCLNQSGFSPISSSDSPHKTNGSGNGEMATPLCSLKKDQGVIHSTKTPPEKPKKLASPKPKKKKRGRPRKKKITLYRKEKPPLKLTYDPETKEVYNPDTDPIKTGVEDG